jgi:hypothetical protein
LRFKHLSIDIVVKLCLWFVRSLRRAVGGQGIDDFSANVAARLSVAGSAAGGCS